MSKSVVRINSVVVERLPGGNVAISMAHHGGLTFRDHRAIVERADVADLIEALAMVEDGTQPP